MSAPEDEEDDERGDAAGESARPQLFASLPPGLAAVFDPRRPWDLLGAPLDELLAGLPSSRCNAPRSVSG